jgi:hypothetical protein
MESVDKKMNFYVQISASIKIVVSIQLIIIYVSQYKLRNAFWINSIFALKLMGVFIAKFLKQINV